MFRSKFMLKLDKFVKLYRDLNLYKAQRRSDGVVDGYEMTIFPRL